MATMTLYTIDGYCGHGVDHRHWSFEPCGPALYEDRRAELKVSAPDDARLVENPQFPGVHDLLLPGCKLPLSATSVAELAHDRHFGLTIV